MPDTRFFTAEDSTRIAYDVSGAGPAVLLLHGFTGQRTLWHESGWVERLSTEFTVITVDLRGHGETDALTDPARYSPAAHLADLHGIADACGAERFALVGFSWGATVARNVAASSDRLTHAVLIGTYFGTIFTEMFLAAMLTTHAHDPVKTAHTHGLRAWPGVTPADLRVPTLVITGTQDGNVVKVLRTQRADIEAAGHMLEIFDGLDHGGLVERVDMVLPRVHAFLAGDMDARP